MYKAGIFFVSCSVIFFIDRMFVHFFEWQTFLFPISGILFMLEDKNGDGNIIQLVAVSLVFDFFSGYSFGLTTIVLLISVLSGFFLRGIFNINSNSIVSTTLLVLLLTLIYAFILSLISSPKVLMFQIITILIEVVCVLISFKFLSSIIKHNDFRKI